MKYLFKDLKGFEDRTLFVIGNGFDLFHDIPSTYMHFYHWLKFKGEDEFISKMEKFFPSMANGEFMLWKDFERALGQFDINEIFEDTIGEIDRKLDERTKVVAIEQLAPIVKQIKPLLRKWIEQIDLSKVKPQLSLPQDSWYISFNYTLTLEKVYKMNVGKEDERTDGTSRYIILYDSNGNEIEIGGYELKGGDRFNSYFYDLYALMEDDYTKQFSDILDECNRECTTYRDKYMNPIP